MATGTAKTSKTKAAPAKKPASAKAKPAVVKSAPKAVTKPRASMAPSPKPPAPKAAPKVVAVKPAPAPKADAKPDLKRQELIDEIVKRTDVKKKFAKPVVEAMLAIMGEALTAERPMNLQPLGKVIPQRSKDTDNARINTVRIRQSLPSDKAKAPAKKPAGSENDQVVAAPTK